jgi:hypothetical protein
MTLVAALSAAPAPEPLVAVVVVQRASVEKDAANGVAEQVAAGLRAAGVPVGMTQSDAAKKLEKLGVESESCEGVKECIVSLGTKLGAQIVVAVHLGGMGNSVAVHLDGLSVRDGKRLAQHDVVTQRSGLKRVGGLEDFGKRLLAAMPPPEEAPPPPHEITATVVQPPPPPLVVAEPMPKPGEPAATVAQRGMPRWPGIVALAVGAVLAGVGTYEVLHAGGLTNDVKSLQDPATGAIPASKATQARQDLDQIGSAKTAGAACLGVGGAVVLGGAAYLIFAPAPSGAQVAVGGTF